MAFALLKSRFWLAHRNGRVCAECGVPMLRGNPYRRGSPSWFAFNNTYAETMKREQRQSACLKLVEQGQ